MTAADKERLRKQATAARESQADKDELSSKVIDRVINLPEYRAANFVMWYVDVRDEVRTRHALPNAIANGKRIVVPYCVGEELHLFRLESMDELEVGRFGILEPRLELQELPTKAIRPNELDLILVPGVAFDVRGRRIGHGKGFYDRLLSRVRDDAIKIGIGFDAQIFDKVPTDAHDVPMHFVVTESQVMDMRRQE